MRGLVFNLLRDVVEDDHGADAWDEVLEAAGSDGVHTTLGAYPDAELEALVGTSAQAAGVPDIDAQRWFGDQALPRLARAHPEFFSPHRSVRTFLMTINDVIHAEVRKLHPGADPPEFGLELVDEDTVLLSYASARRMCGLAEGFVRGAAAHFGEAVEIHQPRCMHRGDEHCLLQITVT